MTTQSQQNSSGFFSSATGQLTLLGIAVVVVLLVAWRYVW